MTICAAPNVGKPVCQDLEARPPPPYWSRGRQLATAGSSYTLWFRAVYSVERNPDIEQLWLSGWRCWHVGSCEPPIFRGRPSPSRPLLLLVPSLVTEVQGWFLAAANMWQPLLLCSHPSFSYRDPFFRQDTQIQDVGHSREQSYVLPLLRGDGGHIRNGLQW